MGVSEEDIIEEEIQRRMKEDFKRAKELMNKIKKDEEIFEHMMPDLNPMLFVLCLIYVRLSKHE
jgi:hypothetical protein